LVIMMADRGITLTHTTILRWVVRRQLFFPINDNYFSLSTTITL
jgi:transposase-like protein